MKPFIFCLLGVSAVLAGCANTPPAAPSWNDSFNGIPEEPINKSIQSEPPASTADTDLGTTQ